MTPDGAFLPFAYRKVGSNIAAPAMPGDSSCCAGFLELLGVRSAPVAEHAAAKNALCDQKLLGDAEIDKIRDLSIDEEVYDDEESKGRVMARLNQHGQMSVKLKAILDEVHKIHNKASFFDDADGSMPQDVDQVTGDKWVPRNRWMNRLIGIHPFSSEAPASLLKKHGFITPNTVHFVRNHGTVPCLKWNTHRIVFEGNFSFPHHKQRSTKTLCMDELLSIFEPVTFACTLNCAGNRRKEQNMIQKGIGFDWGLCGVSTAVWTGVPLYKVLEYIGINSKENGGNFVNFFGPAGELPMGDGTYGASHSRERCMDPSRNFMLAFMMNGELLHPDHGYPVRLLCPGYIGGRMIKWLSKITVSELEDDNWYHINDNRVFPKHITSREVATAEKIWKDPAYCIHDRNINSAIWSPAHCEKVNISDPAASYTICGYAYAGAGHPVNRVEITLNGGRNWHPAEIVRPDEKADASAHDFGKRFCWVHWTIDIPMTKLANCGEFAVRAWDDSQNCQPERPSWNLMGMMNNPWFRIKVHKSKGALQHSIWFEHPTRAEPNLKHSYDLERDADIALECTEDGALISPGWMTRMRSTVIKVYKPFEKTDEVLDPNEGWEVDMKRWIDK